MSDTPANAEPQVQLEWLFCLFDLSRTKTLSHDEFFLLHKCLEESSRRMVEDLFEAKMTRVDLRLADTLNKMRTQPWDETRRAQETELAEGMAAVERANLEVEKGEKISQLAPQVTRAATDKKMAQLMSRHPNQVAGSAVGISLEQFRRDPDIVELLGRGNPYLDQMGDCKSLQEVFQRFSPEVYQMQQKYTLRQKSMEDLFKLLDRNNDGRVTENELLLVGKILHKGKRTWTKEQNKELVVSVKSDDGAAAPEDQRSEISFSLEEFLGFYRSVIYDLDDARFEKGRRSFEVTARRAAKRSPGRGR